MQESSMDIRATLARFAFLFDGAPTYLSAKQSRGMQAAQQHWDFVTFRKYQLFFYNICRFLHGLAAQRDCCVQEQHQGRRYFSLNFKAALKPAKTFKMLVRIRSCFHV
ncbi:hypothetical protein DVH05_002952 [Phytophthora capsici]|nr:hypothetical protein DVH05_002952 [Phytophthora capsici]